MALSEVLLEEIAKIDNHEDIERAWDLLRWRNNKLQRKSLRKFNVGEPVIFPGKDGEFQAGVIIKLNKRTAKVQVGTDKWTVEAGLLISAT